MIERLLLGLVLSTAIGALAYRRKSLTHSGVAGAIITGTTIFGCAGLLSGLLLIAFFVSSSALSHYKKGELRKRQAGELFDKHSQRDLGQTLANGGFAAICAVMMLLHDANWLLPLLGALATVNADTWATELGTLSRTPPRLITNLRQVVPVGTSGGVTLLGTFVSLCGAAFIGLSLLILSTLLLVILVSIGNESLIEAFGIPFYGLIVPLMTVVAGFIGSLSDSILGATVQVIYYSPQRGKETERPHEPNGEQNRFMRGWRWLNNDWVNFIASVIGGAVMAGLVKMLG